jgi:hypothetical protein
MTYKNGYQAPALLLLVAALVALAACKKDGDGNASPTSPVNEEELITSLYIRFIPMGGGDTALFSFVDLDGDGGAPPVLVGDTLATGMGYEAEVWLLNASLSPVDTISLEVLAEGDQHQFFYSTIGSALAWSAYGDLDVNGLPIGLYSEWTTNSAPGQGTFTVVLRHQPDKTAAGVAAGDISNAGGETDIEVTLPYTVL